MRLSILLFLISCENNEYDFNTKNESEDKTPIVSEITVEDGYLRFTSDEVFESFIADIENSDNHNYLLFLTLKPY